MNCVRKLFDLIRRKLIGWEKPCGSEPRYIIQTPVGLFEADRYLPCSYGTEFIRVREDGQTIHSVVLNTGVVIHDFNSSVTVEDFDLEQAKRESQMKSVLEQLSKKTLENVGGARSVEGYL